MKTYKGRPGVTVNGDPDYVESYLLTHKETHMAENDNDHMDERPSLMAPKPTDTPASVVAAGPEKSKRMTVLLRFMRTLGASILGFIAVWAAGPDALSLVTDPLHQTILLSVVVPMLVAAEKALRYGDDQGEDPNDTLL